VGVVDEEVSQGVDGVVVNAVFQGQFAGKSRLAGVRVVVALHSLNKARASGRDYEGAFAVAGADSPADKLNALEDTASFESGNDSERSQLPDDACTGNVVDSRSGGVAEGGGDLLFSAGRSGLYLGGVHVDGGPAADVFIDDADDAVAIDLEPEADKGIDESKVERAIERQVRVVIARPDVDIGVELSKDDILQRWSSAEHLGLEASPAGAAHLRDAVVDFQIAVGVFRLATTVRPQGTLRAGSIGALFDYLPHTPLEDWRAELGRGGDDSLHQAVGTVHCADQLHSGDEIGRALGGELGGGEDIFIEKLDLITAELLDVLAADAGRRLREDLDLRVIGESALAF